MESLFDVLSYHLMGNKFFLFSVIDVNKRQKEKWWNILPLIGLKQTNAKTDDDDW